ncbi:MAG: hypothetical protein KIT80_12230 [Chitinophagaceae bacterium]|nr:hypothetical protein [Chitinophagaceae bacterium]MCW5927670.1 hypothetical protein [Chitinophagaceae bacterium]
MIKYLFSSIGIVMLFIGCSKYNPAKTPFAIYHPISEDSVRKLEKGVTTRNETIRLFGGTPSNSISDRGEKLVYGYLGDTLVVYFDPNNVVGSFLYRPDIFNPVDGSTDDNKKKIRTSRVNKIRIYEHNIFRIADWFGKYSRKETGANRNRYTYIRRNGTLVVYTLADMEERVLSYSFTPSE